MLGLWHIAWSWLTSRRTGPPAGIVFGYEALLKFLQDENIPVFGVNIGVVNAKDVKRASIMNERKKPESGTLAARGMTSRAADRVAPCQALARGRANPAGVGEARNPSGDRFDAHPH